MKEKYLKINNLSVSENLANFINKELLPGTNINKKRFWNGFDKCVHELAPKNRKLLQKRERLQKAIDALHIDKKNNKIPSTNYSQLFTNTITTKNIAQQRVREFFSYKFVKTRSCIL